ncbi:MAG: 2-amino-4-hydroxy-6-hydroxymethyldihydropteridine diphosphokinase [Gammaproteobacteria bacterium]|nr:2-amino-4-hydroxy-6-hydroxymethyldihydropteridine diphosphokinase [Gammaproteobacteria bacterium]
MAFISISLGSNINREQNLQLAVSELRERYGNITLSPVYETAAVGFEGADFLNLVVSLHTERSIERVVKELKGIEDSIGRDRSQPKFSARKIDLDLLTYDDQVVASDPVPLPRDEILKYAFVLKPMSDIMGEQIHPVVGKNYHQLWAEMSHQGERITRVEIDLN